MAGKRAPYSNRTILNDAYDLTKTKACLFFRHFYDGVFILILSYISDTDLKIMFLMIHTILMTLVKTRLKSAAFLRITSLTRSRKASCLRFAMSVFARGFLSILFM